MRITLIKTKLIRTFSLLIFLVATVASIQSCYPGDELTYSDTDIVATFFDDTTDFSLILTFAMPDSVFHISDSTLTSGNVDRTYDQQILNNIEENLLALGFTEAVNPVDADVHVVAMANKTTLVSGGCYYSYWYYYYPWCYPVVYTYTTGSVIILMATNDPGNNKAVWIAGINGLLDESFSTNVSGRININIDQAFTQSPYLGEGK